MYIETYSFSRPAPSVMTSSSPSGLSLAFFARAAARALSRRDSRYSGAATSDSESDPESEADALLSESESEPDSERERERETGGVAFPFPLLRDAGDIAVHGSTGVRGSRRSRR